MDILAAMFAYLACITGIVAGLAMSFVVFFSPPGQLSPKPRLAIAMARPSHATAAPVSPVTTVAKAEIRPSAKPGAKWVAKTGASNTRLAAAAAKTAVRPVASDARQRPLKPQNRLRRLAEKERARELAYREHSSFESRFLHFDD